MMAKLSGLRPWRDLGMTCVFLAAGGCLPKATDPATTGAIGGLMAFDLSACVEKSTGWASYDACEAALTACAKSAKTVGQYDACSDRVVR